MSETTAAKFATREEWLTAAIAALAPKFEALGHTIPAVRVSVGWPGGRGSKNSVIGQCWPGSLSSDGIGQVFISPKVGSAVQVLDILTHELVHAVNHAAGDNGHGAAFSRIAKPLGLTGKMTATVAGPELEAELTALADDLGVYPHGAITQASPGKTQGTRMLKVECASGNGYVVRMTRKWLDEYGTPTCPCHDEAMEEA